MTSNNRTQMYFIPLLLYVYGPLGQRCYACTTFVEKVLCVEILEEGIVIVRILTPSIHHTLCTFFCNFNDGKIVRDHS